MVCWIWEVEALGESYVGEVYRNRCLERVPGDMYWKYCGIGAFVISSAVNQQVAKLSIISLYM